MPNIIDLIWQVSYFTSAADAAAEKARKSNNCTDLYSSQSNKLKQPNYTNLSMLAIASRVASATVRSPALERLNGCCRLVVRIEACGAFDPSSNLGSSTPPFFLFEKEKSAGCPKKKSCGTV